MRIEIIIGKTAKKVLADLGSADAKRAMKMLLEGTNAKFKGKYDLDEAEIAALLEQLTKNLDKMYDRYGPEMKRRLRLLHRKQFGIISIESQ